ncbi:Uncharacterised protein [Mycobacteroides abscessus]|nr:Uncharacterised protein [Mycobacteroides abscessus]
MPSSVRTGTTSRMTSGRHTNAVARTMPGGAKITWSPASSRAPPNQPFFPYTRTSESPTTIGETDSGRSSRALRSALPGKSYRTMSIEIPTPNTVLISTTCTATAAVSWSAKTTDGSARARWNVSSPSANAPRTTSETGHPTSSTR